MNKKIDLLLVEDDPNLGMILQEFLQENGYLVTLSTDGEEALEYFISNKFQLCIVDVMLPKKDGYCLVEDIRKKDKNIPIIFLTARGLKEDKIKGFKLGCDDYIVKPFSTEELALRIGAILKRAHKKEEKTELDFSGIIQIGKYHFDFMNLSLKIDDKETLLTSKEAALLKLLYQNKNKLLTRTLALNTLWEKDDYYSSRSMDVFITKLRKYLQDDDRIKIQNLHGNGFKFNVPEN